MECYLYKPGVFFAQCFSTDSSSSLFLRFLTVISNYEYNYEYFNRSTYCQGTVMGANIVFLVCGAPPTRAFL